MHRLIQYYADPMPHFICPRCKQRSVDIDAREGFSRETPACRHCGFGFLFELMEDYYPGPNTGLVVCDQQGRVLATGKGVFELTGYREHELIGREVTEIVEPIQIRSPSRSNGACGGWASRSG